MNAPRPASPFLPPSSPKTPKTTQVYFPAALLDELVARLDGGGASLAADHRQVADLLGRVRGAALAQTSVIQQVFA